MRRIYINGMMCEHCAAYVKKALEELGASSVTIDLAGGFADAEISCSLDEIRSRLAEDEYEVTKEE